MIKVRIVDWGNDPLLEEFEDIVEDYDGGLCVNRTPEERAASQQREGLLI